MHRIKSKENKEAISEKENSYIDQINLNAQKKKPHSHYKRSFPTIQTRNKADIKLLMLEKATFSGFAWTQK